MSKPRRAFSSSPLEAIPFSIKPRRPIPYEFVLEAVAALSPTTRPMFGCVAIYIQQKIFLILRDKPAHPADNGVWLATAREHHASLRAQFPNMRSIEVLGRAPTGWQVLPADAPDFEEAALRACDLVLVNDPRIGRVPGARRTSKHESKKSAKLNSTGKDAGQSAKPRSRKTIR